MVWYRRVIAVDVFLVMRGTCLTLAMCAGFVVMIRLLDTLVRDEYEITYFANVCVDFGRKLLHYLLFSFLFNDADARPGRRMSSRETRSSRNRSPSV
jgi:hypothetical protein